MSDDHVPAASAGGEAGGPGPGADEARELAFRRSLRASRGRRAAHALRRRRLLRGRGSLLAIAAALLAAGGGAIAAPDRGSAGPGPGSDAIRAAQRALGVAADGIVGPRTRAATRRFQRRRDLVVDGIIGPRTLRALGVDTAGAAPAAAAPAAGGLLERIAACESGGDPTAVSADGRYRGKYQFSRATWRRMGGRGDPARASEREQDRRAARLLRRAGTGPWPNCAR